MSDGKFHIVSSDEDEQTQHDRDGCDCCGEEHEVVILAAEARTGMTLKGLLGALYDLEAIDDDIANDVAKRLGIEPEFSFARTVADGNIGIEVELPEGELLSADALHAALDGLTEDADDDCDSPASILRDIYAVVESACADEQDAPANGDPGSFGRTDIVFGLALAAEGLAGLGTYYSVTTVELGLGETLDNGIPVSQPTTLSATLAANAELEVSVSTGAAGTDTPCVAILATLADAQTDEVRGKLIRMGCGIDGDIITRLYMLSV